MIDKDMIIKLLPESIKNNDKLYNNILNTLTNIIDLLNNNPELNTEHRNLIFKQVYILLYKLGIDSTIIKDLVVRKNINEIIINNVNYAYFKEQALNVFDNYKIEISPSLDKKLQLLFLRLYYVSQLPNVNQATITEINSLTSNLYSAIDPGIRKVEIKVGDEYIKKFIKPSSIRGNIMSNVSQLNSKYYEIINNLISQISNEMNHSVIKAISALIQSYDSELINMFNSTFTFDSSKVLNISALSKADDAVQNEVLNYVLSQSINVNDEVYNILSGLDFSEVSNSRIESLAMDSVYFRSIISILNAKFLRNEDKQFLIEKFALEYELNYFKLQLENQTVKSSLTLFKDNYSDLIKALDILIGKYTKNKFELLKKAGASEAKIAILLILFDREKLASIIFSTIIKILSNVRDVNEPVVKSALSMELAEQVLRAFFYSKKNTLPAQVEKLFPEYSDYKIFKNLEPVEKAQLGLALIDSVLVKLSIISSETVTIDKESSTIISLKSNYIEILSKDGLDPMKLPMVCPPLKCDKDHQGGYLTEAVRYYNNKNLDIIHQNPLNKFSSEPSQMQYDSINHLNKQAFVINKDVLNFILTEWEREDNNGIFGEYNKKREKPQKLLPFHKEYKKIQTHNSLFWTYRNIINIATIYQDYTIYLPTYMDFRGRIYPYIPYLSYQGNDLARGLLNFAHNEPITEKGFEYMIIYMAGVYGLSSETFENRISWFHNNFDMFYNLWLENTNKFNEEVLSKAKEKFQFMSVFLAIVKLISNHEKPIGTPILFDCSCSGMQHLASLCSDLTLAKMVNVVPAEGRSDFYSIAAEQVTNSLEKANLPAWESLSKINIDRTVMKIPVMTIPYNISLSGICDKLESTIVLDKFFENEKCYYRIKSEFIKGNTNKEYLTITSQEFNILSKKVYDSLYEIIPSLKKLIEFLNSLVQVLQNINKPIIWITPSNLKINLSMRKFESVRTKTKLLSSAKPITISIPSKKGGFNKKDIQKGFIANLIHSLDASNIHILINLLKDSNLEAAPLYTIHDCFATTPNNMEKLNKVILSAFIQLYFEKNYLLELMHNVKEQIRSYGYEIIDKNGEQYIIGPDLKEPELFPTIPMELLSNWELNKKVFIEGIKKSKYFIS
jgi:DNA-directed RNA polymerase